MSIKRLALIATLAALSGRTTLAAAEPLSAILNNYSSYDINSDGTREINSLTPLSGVESNVDSIPTDKPLVVVFVEPRLMNTVAGATFTAQQLQERLIRFKEDLANDGLRSVVLSASVYGGPTHQDGRTVLALRRFLKSVKASYRLDGAVFVGRFPEASVVHKIIWRWAWNPTMINGTNVGDHEILRVDSGLIAPRTDAPLADLDGRWESVYNQAATDVETIHADPMANWPANWPQSTTYRATLWTRFPRNYRDFFLVDDAQYSTAVANDGSLSVTLNMTRRNPEVGDTDRQKATPMGYPEIYVSRINPYSAAFQEDRNYRDATGQGLFDASGRPRTLIGAAGPGYGADAVLERALLVAYFDENHLHRVGAYASRPFRAGTVTNPDSDFPVAGYSPLVTGARADFQAAFDAAPNPTLAQYASWLNESVTLRQIMSHSNGGGAVYGTAAAADMQNAAGPAHHWVYSPGLNQWQPTWEGPYLVWASQPMYRSMWANGKFNLRAPTFYLHGGCETNTPYDNGATLPYTQYGGGQHAESMMFFGKGLAVMARAKIFYDQPQGWQPYFRGNANAKFGDVWKKHFETRASNPPDGDRSAVKSTYWWGVLGDYTLRLRYEPRPEASSVVPNPIVAGSWLTVWGTRFGSATGTVTFAGGVNGTISSWRDDSIVVRVPSGAVTGGLVVTAANGLAGRPVAVEIKQAAPRINSVSPTLGAVGTVVTVTGTNFGSVRNTSYMMLNGVSMTTDSWSDTSISFRVFTGATSGNIVVSVGGSLSNGVFFTVGALPPVDPPLVTSTAPFIVPRGRNVTVWGKNFGAVQGSSRITIGGAVGTPINWRDEAVTLPVPAGSAVGIVPVVVTVNGRSSNSSVTMEVTAGPPVVTSITPTSGRVGATFVITGSNFGSRPGTSFVSFNGGGTWTTSWTDTQIVAGIPSYLSPGPTRVGVNVGLVESNTLPLTVLP